METKEITITLEERLKQVDEWEKVLLETVRKDAEELREKFRKEYANGKEQ